MKHLKAVNRKAGIVETMVAPPPLGSVASAGQGSAAASADGT